MNTSNTQNPPATPYVIVLTGTMSRPRKEISDDIEAAGHVVKAAITAEVTHLVQADPFSESSKTRKANELGIKIIDEEELMEMINQ